MEHLPGDEPLEAAQDVLVAQPFRLASFGVGLGLLMPAQPHHRDAMQSGIGLTIASPVEPVMPSVAGAGLQRAGTADRSERGFRTNPLRVIADCSQQHGGAVNADAIALTQARACRLSQLVEIAHQGLELGVQGLNTAGQAAQRSFGGFHRPRQDARAKAGAGGDELAAAEPFEPFTQRNRSGDQK